MSSDSINNSAELSGELSSLNIGNNDNKETITIVQIVVKRAEII